MSNNNDKLISTEELERLLKNTSDISSTVEKYKESMVELQCSECIKIIIAQSGKSNSSILRQLNLSSSYFYEIINGKKAPSRDVFLQVLIATKSGLDQSQIYLKECGYRQLYPRSRRDAIMIYALSNNKNLIETNILLDSMNLTPLN